MLDIGPLLSNDGNSGSGAAIIGLIRESPAPKSDIKKAEPRFPEGRRFGLRRSAQTSLFYIQLT
ncbi:hypothetical protein PSTEL_01590 [Paenibacillus stellifer]|uniref:Uncharacterized protein n=1 Tax=Paenibacillus stellifer TaxID=169760 RepID=A0A089LMA8_9BACL|nr:hypothetical protein PSTEL_01590 [Paenibacillus stellifer]